MKKLSGIISIFVFQSILGAEEHRAWELAGAQARIEVHRMGDLHLNLRLPNGDTVPHGTRYTIKQREHAFQFGGSLSADWQAPKQDWYSNFKSQFAQLFNYATINFYWAVHEKQYGQWNYLEASREQLQWAQAEGMTLRGHPLMWHEVLPAWMTDSKRDVAAIAIDIQNHVRRLLEGYPQIDEWDVYNEAIGIKWRDEKEGVRRWFESIGGPGEVSEYLIGEARAVSPDARLILNHYTDLDVEYEEQIEHCLKAGAKFEVIGIQTHMHTEMDSINEARLWGALEKYARFGKPLHLSEISILSCERFKDWKRYQAWIDKVERADAKGIPRPLMPSTPKLEEYQAELARDFYTLAFSHPAVEAIIWWTITDLEPWRGMPAGLLDAEGRPKPVYKVLDQLINQEWCTQLEGMVDAGGRIQGRGFYGSYTLNLELNGRSYNVNFELKQGSRKPLTLELMTQ
ncbi:MAG: Anti-sigma-I factor RsgI6 [Opitutia bacterium UBA7350]|nr:MAG: Anti-sigma-I factor RsgI6 [Opitutae bacterium UBA7350]